MTGRRPSFAASEHKHKHIPNCATSHPDNPIPTEPDISKLNIVSPPMRPYHTIASPRSSAASLTTEGDDTSDSDFPPTPPSESHDLTLEEGPDKLQDLPRPVSPAQRKRKTSTTFASNTEDIRMLLGNGANTQLLLGYCCGEGCCKSQALPAETDVTNFKPVLRPDNDAFRFLNPNLGSLMMDTELCEILELPESKITFGGLRKQSISEKFPGETKHSHDQETVNVRPPEYMKPHPPYDIFNAPVYGARELTKPGAEKRTFHFDLDVTEYPKEGGIDFKVGGAIGVCPPNDPAVVDDTLDQLGVPRFIRDKHIRLFTTGGRWPTIWGDDKARELVTTRREILTWTVDVTSTAPTKPLFRVLAEYATAPNEKKILEFLCSAQGQSAFCDLRTGPHITLQQLLHAFPSSKPPLEALLGGLGQLMPRFYSLSNDPHISSAREGLAGRRLVEIAVTIHETSSFGGNKRTGVGSGFLEHIASRFVAAEEQAVQLAAEGKAAPLAPGVAGRRLNLQVPMFRGLMANPLSREFASDGPMMLIGAGVGMAPFRGFILNRLKNANCANKIWLIQGIRDATLDNIYHGELGGEEHEKSIKKIVQSRVTAPPPVFDETDSKPEGDPLKQAKNDRKSAKYVQDEVRLQADIVWFVINASDGRIFVCGSTGGMYDGVEQALIDVAMDKGGLDFETAKAFWTGKKAAGQYVAENW